MKYVGVRSGAFVRVCFLLLFCVSRLVCPTGLVSDKQVVPRSVVLCGCGASKFIFEDQVKPLFFLPSM